MRSRVWQLAYLLICCAVNTPMVSLSSVTNYVCPGSGAGGPGTSWATAFHDIQGAINVSTNGDTVLVSNGVYSVNGAVTPGGSVSNRIVVTNSVTVRSVNGPIYTTITGQGPCGNNAVRCAFLTNNAVLSGFTLSNGCTRTTGNLSEDQSGGGVHASSAFITNCFITGCSAYYAGGAAYGGILNGCTITGNSSSNYGGGTCYSIASNCTFTGNSAKYGGGTSYSIANNSYYNGNYASTHGGGTYYGTNNNCAISDNSALTYGGGMYYGTINNCIVCGNSANSGGGTYFGSVGNSIVYYNSSLDEATYNFYSGSYSNSCAFPTPAGLANKTNEPVLVSTSHISTNSPCVTGGAYVCCTGVDIDGEAWTNPPSIGCDQYNASGITGTMSVAVNADCTNTSINIKTAFSSDIKGRLSRSVWNFGDGTYITNMPYVTHAWNSSGTFPVILTAYSLTYPGGISATVNVQVISQPTHYVSVNSTGSLAPFLSWGAAATNIQEAIQASTTRGARILVSNGVYSTGLAITPGGSLTNRIVATNAIIVQSVNGPTVTTIVGRGPIGSSAIRCAYLADDAVLTGFTLSNGYTQSDGQLYKDQSGGGVYAYGATISNCIIYANSAEVYGGGIFYGTVNGSIIRGNSANSCGGGTAYSTLNNCTVAGNSAVSFGGGTYYGDINNSIVQSNSATIGADFYLGTFQYSCTYPVPSGTSNITNSPNFVNYATGDFHLSGNSMCINGGNNTLAPGTLDIEGNGRIQASVVDMGAYESSFAPIDAWSHGYGTIVPVGRVSALVSNNQSFTMTVTPGYPPMLGVKIDGVGIGRTNSYTFYSLTSNHTIEVYFWLYPDTNGYSIKALDWNVFNTTVLRWKATNGWYYTLQQTPSLTPVAWEDVSPHTNMTGLGDMVITNVPGTNSQIFYRLIAIEQ